MQFITTILNSVLIVSNVYLLLGFAYLNGISWGNICTISHLFSALYSLVCCQEGEQTAGVVGYMKEREREQKKGSAACQCGII